MASCAAPRASTSPATRPVKWGSTSAVKYLNRPLEWLKSDEAARVAENLLSYQAQSGGWPKNVDTAGQKYQGDPERLHATYDNKATTDELRYIARMYVATKNEKYRQSFMRGLTYVLSGQYDNGGWPQSNPPGKKYDHYITFNDGSMARLMFFVREVARDDLYGFVDAGERKKCADAFERGIDCILKCQIRVNGRLTAWCAQHDERDFSPRPARTFELASLSGAESVGVVHVLMSVEHPSTQIIEAVDAAVAWFQAVKIPGIREVDTPEKGRSKGFRREVVEDPTAPPMWARFYEIGTNRAIFSDRDGVRKYKLSEIGDERRNGYHWLGYWPADLLAREYPEWRAKWRS